MIFGSDTRLDKEMNDLRERIGKLQERVAALEAETAPFRIGPDHRESDGLCFYNYPDQRPKLSTRKAIELIREHLKLRWSHIPALPECIVVEKERK